MTRVRALYWQDIPSVVKTTGEDGHEVRRQLPEWFQQEIDRVAMAQGLVGSDAYLKLATEVIQRERELRSH